MSIEIFDAEKRTRQIDLTKNFQSGQEINIKPADIINENSNKSTKQKGKVLINLFKYKYYSNQIIKRG